MGWRNPLEISEFEVHVEAFNRLKQVYRNVRGEFHFKVYGKQAARFDIALLNPDNNVELVVEIKRANKRMWAKQRNRYQEITGKPCVVICGMDEANETVERVERELKARYHNKEYYPDIYR